MTSSVGGAAAREQDHSSGVFMVCVCVNVRAKCKEFFFGC